MGRAKKCVLEVFELLKKRLKIKNEVVLHFRKLNNDFGECFPSEDDEEEPIEIVIDGSLCRDMQIETLLHEYAHALLFDREDDYSYSHNDKWGITYAKVYRCYLRHYINKPTCKK